MAFHVVQLTDLHLLREANDELLGYTTEASFQSVLNAVPASSPDLLLLTGDLAQDASERGYERVAELIQPLKAPCYAIPGNHDDPGGLATALSRPPFRAERSFEAGGWRFLMLDTHVSGEVYGQLGAEMLRWLDSELTAHADQPALLALHHPPRPVGTPWLDRILLQETEALGDLVAAHEQVRVMLSGHVHQAYEGQWQGAKIMTTPSTCFQFMPGADEFALDEEAAPGRRHLRLYADGSFETSVERVEEAICTPDATATGY